MGISYIGNCEWTENAEPDFNVDLYDLDNLTRSFEGRSDKTTQFLQVYTVGKPDTVETGLSFSGYTQGGDHGIASLKLHFIGKRNGANQSRRQTEYDERIQTATLTGLTTGVQLNVTYLSPMVRTRWGTQVRPKQSDGYQAYPDGKARILSISGSNGVQLAASGSTMEKIITSAEFQAKRSYQRTSFPRIQFGKWWRNTEIIEAVLIQQANLITL